MFLKFILAILCICHIEVRATKAEQYFVEVFNQNVEEREIITPGLLNKDPFTFPCAVPPPDYFRCPQRDGAFPHPTNCSLYYTCKNDCAIERECVAPLRYNAVLNRCENLTTTQFCVKAPPPLKGDSFDGVMSLYKCTRDGVFPDPEFCDKYYSCMNAVAYRYTCTNKLFDTRYNSCNFPEITPCEERLRPEHHAESETVTPPPSTTTTEATPINPCRETHMDDKSYYYQDPTDCAKFFICQNGILLFSSECPRDLFFDEAISVCNFKELVQCKVMYKQ